MNQPRIRSACKTRILFVWDGTSNHIRQVDQFFELEDRCEIIAVHPMAHASVYSYGTPAETRVEDGDKTGELRERFAKSIGSTRNLGHLKLEFLFGERIDEIVRKAESSKVDLILAPRFRQSAFSRWLHGDLNERLTRKSPCCVWLLDHDEPTQKTTDSSHDSNCNPSTTLGKSSEETLHAKEGLSPSDDPAASSDLENGVNDVRIYEY